MSAQSSFRDWYRVFDLPYNSSEHDIKQRYRQMMREWHPDKREIQTGYELHRSQELNEAYAILRDPLKRADYDKTYFSELKKRADRLKAAANEAYRSNSFIDAVRLYSDAISLDPQNAVFYSNRSMAYGGLSDWASARLDAERAVLLNPEYMKGHYNLTRALVKLGSLTDADNVLTTALVLFPDDSDLRRLRADLDLYLKKLQAKATEAAAEKTANFGYTGVAGSAVPPFSGGTTRDKSPSLPSMTPPRKVSPRTYGASESTAYGDAPNGDPFVRAPHGQPQNPAPPPPKTHHFIPPPGGEGVGEPGSPFYTPGGERPTKWRLGTKTTNEEVIPKNPGIQNRSLGLSALRSRLFSRSSSNQPPQQQAASPAPGPEGATS